MRTCRLILAPVIILLISCAPKYASDPMDVYNEDVDLASREEVREIEGEFWCTEYGDYFAPRDSGEIWCTFGGGLCPKYLSEAEKYVEDGSLGYYDLYCEVVLSGTVGTLIEGYYELDCSRTFNVTMVHEFRIGRPWSSRWRYGK